MSPDQDINNSQASTAQWASLHHRRITAPWSSDSWSKMALANIHPCFSSSSFGHSRQTSVERERGDYCGLIKVKVVDISAQVWPWGYIWDPIMSRSEAWAHNSGLQSANGPLCWPSAADQSFLSKLQCLPPRSCCMMYPNVSKSIQSVGCGCICDMWLNIWRYWSTLCNCHGVNWKQTSLCWTIFCCSFAAFRQMLHD